MKSCGVTVRMHRNDQMWRCPLTAVQKLLLVVTCCVVTCCLGGHHADADAIVVKGQVGVIGEWALKANLDPPQSGGTGSAQLYSGILNLRHVGFCSVEGPEEKTGRATASIHGGVADQLTLAFGTDNCVYPGPLHLSSKVSRGFMRCKSGFQVPISLWTVPQ